MADGGHLIRRAAHALVTLHRPGTSTQVREGDTWRTVTADIAVHDIRESFAALKATMSQGEFTRRIFNSLLVRMHCHDLGRKKPRERKALEDTLRRVLAGEASGPSR
jgi:hypothetical protein